MIPDEARLIEARRLRDAARGVVRTDLATLKRVLAERPIGLRIRQHVVDGVSEAASDGMALARENRLVVALTLSTLAAWLFRKRLAHLACMAFARTRQAIAPTRAKPWRWRG